MAQSILNVHHNVAIPYPDETKQAIRELLDIGQWIKENMHKEGFLDKYGHVVERFRKVSQDMKLLLEKEELLALRTKSRAHRFPWEILYNDLRRFLLKHPL